MDGPIQGYDAVYKKLDKHPTSGHEIYPEWYVRLSGPFPVSAICDFYLETMLEGDDAAPLNRRTAIFIKKLAKIIEEDEK
ncbi:hypothetical protein LCGC14_0338710 [marine sediment metagenome]|uniref:Uncharacterized protein n=1 Tax=marine sediment metagenome TaxID=412755 RepID=A0A0F9TXI2_9ZZZZ